MVQNVLRNFTQALFFGGMDASNVPFPIREGTCYPLIQQVSCCVVSVSRPGDGGAHTIAAVP